MTHDGHVHDYVDDYLHDLLSPEDADRVGHHCEGCASCRAALEQARRRQSVMESVPAVEAPQPLVHATLDRIDAHELGRRRFRRRFLLAVPLAAAAAAVLIAACHVYFYNLTVTPTDLQVLGQTTLLAGSSGSLRVRLLDRQTGRPLAGVPVAVEMRRQGDKDFVELAQFQTDANGTGAPRFNLAGWDEGDVELRVVAQTEGKPEVLTQPLKLKRSWKLMLSTDKPVYQPGQTILVRGLALGKPDLKPVAGQVMAFTVTDPKGNVLFQHRPSTSKFGIASAECPLATELIEGPYQVACKLGDTESKVTVQVKKYVLPKFKVDVILDKPYYAPGDKVRATVQADYFFGKPVAGGEVIAEVQANEIGRQVLGSAKAKTDDRGRVVFEFALPRQLFGRPQDSGDARIAVAVQVTDTAGQKQARSVSRVVTSNPLRVEVIPEAGELVQDVKNTVYLYARYADGRPAARASVEVTGVEKKLTTNDLGVASFEVTPNQSRIVLTIGAKDDRGVAGVRKVWLECGQVGNDFLLRTDKAVYKGGDTLKLVALGGGVEPVFVDLIKDGQTILTDSIDMRSGKGERAIDLPAELFGTVELCAYRFGEQGLAVRKTRALFIRQTRRLDLKAKLDQKEYRPGGKAKLALTLTDPKGKPAPGAISLAGVDEAVFRVLEQRPGLEARFFVLEQELLKPVYTIYPAWDPDMDNDLPVAERDRFEQALFARTWQTVRQLAFGGKAAGGMAMNEPMFAPAPAPMVAGGIRREVPQAAPVREASPDILAAESFPVKEREVKEMRRSGLKGVTIAWVALGLSILLAGYVALWLFVPKWLVAVLHGVAALVVLPLVCLVLPVVFFLSARSGARMEMAAGMAARDWMAEMAPMKMEEAPRLGAQGPDAGGMAPGAAPAVRVREEFPETLLWRPEIITDDEGRASLDIDLADSITTWRLTASAVTADGRLGATQAGLRVFQPFFVDLNLPVALTRNDEVSVPVVVYNYLKEPQTVELKLEVADWFELTGEPVQKIELAANEVRS
ncbi:MAG TPA: alpha-2-macroglobulin family protein, partial [Gemmataceae bacterium]|nr:alpha-2-macroglobulin family protein [Gemmataceae bacterium]